jgi:hypothetical protein
LQAQFEIEELLVVDVVNTPVGQKSLSVCKDGTNENEDWVKVYEESFPSEQRQNLNELRTQLGNGLMELDETRDQDGNIMCMTITEVFPGDRGLKIPPFLLACYTAVVPAMRGCGIGSIHRRKLGELLSKEYPTYLGLFSEIESTKVEGLPPDVMQTRVKRKSFFMRLGLIPLPIDYIFPSYHSDDKPIHGELLWVPFETPQLAENQLAGVVKRIYVDGYDLPPDDSLVDKVLSQFN